LNATAPGDRPGFPAPDPNPKDVALDMDAFARLCDDVGVDGAAEAVAVFEAETRDRLIAIQSDGLDPARLTREIHSLKGTAIAMGAPRLSGRAAALEERLKRGGAMDASDVAALAKAFAAWSADARTHGFAEAGAA